MEAVAEQWNANLWPCEIRMKRFTIAEIVDYSNRTCVPPPAATWLNHLLRRIAQREADIYFLRAYLRILLFNCLWLACLLMPFGYLQVTIFYLAYFFVAFGAMSILHASAHRKLMKQGWGWLDRAVFYFAGLSLGYPPEYFAIVHIPNHHAENNSDHDLGATLRFNRVRLVAYLYNVAAFCLQQTGFFGLLAMLRRRKRSIWKGRLVWGEIAFWCVVAIVAWFDWRKAVAFMVVPFFLMHFVDRTINWVEHMFIDPDAPLDSWSNAITILGTLNRGIGNGGYHAAHHLRPNMLECDLPKFFERNIDTFLKRSLIFYDTDHGLIMLNVWLRNFRYLRKHLVVLDTDPRSDDEIMDEFRRRLRPIRELPTSALAA